MIVSLSFYRYFEIYCFIICSKTLTSRENDDDNTKLEKLHDPKGYQYSKRALHVNFTIMLLIIMDTF